MPPKQRSREVLNLHGYAVCLTVRWGLVSEKKERLLLMRLLVCSHMQTKIPLFSDSRGRLSLQGYWGFFRLTDKPIIFRISFVGARHACVVFERPKITEISLRNGVCFLLIVGAIHESPENERISVL